MTIIREDQNGNNMWGSCSALFRHSNLPFVRRVWGKTRKPLTSLSLPELRSLGGLCIQALEQNSRAASQTECNARSSSYWAEWHYKHAHTLELNAGTVQFASDIHSAKNWENGPGLLRQVKCLLQGAQFLKKKNYVWMLHATKIKFALKLPECGNNSIQHIKLHTNPTRIASNKTGR